MHWAYEMAEKLIKKYPDREVFTCAAGISPSGSIHAGNFREAVTTFFVVKALEHLGKKTRFIFSWDDIDRLRKIPKNIPDTFEKYIGLPYSDVPNPFGSGSFACHFEQEFERAMERFEMYPEYIYQTREYRSGRYTPYILTAMKRRKEIYDILAKFKSSEPSEEERDAFYPISLYCPGCGKDSIFIRSYNEELNQIDAECECGRNTSQNIDSSTNIKLNWKVDWAMRWMVEDVVFEPGGRDHSSSTGSYNVSKVIAVEIFDFEAPAYTAYEFIGLKGNAGKMSSSSGNVVTPQDLLNIYTPEIILFMFAKNKPNAAFNIGFDDDVLRNYAEFERYLSAWSRGSLKEENILKSLELSSLNVSRNYPNFAQIAGLFPLIDFNEDVLINSLKEIGETYSLGEVKEISGRVAHWIKHWNPHRLVAVNHEKNYSYYYSLSEQQQSRVQMIANLIGEASVYGDEFMGKVYSLCHQEDKKAMKSCQKELFKDVYQLVFNNNSGPRLPLLLSALGKEKMYGLLKFE